jgi:hypothetical protein
MRGLLVGGGDVSWEVVGEGVRKTSFCEDGTCEDGGGVMFEECPGEGETNLAEWERSVVGMALSVASDPDTGPI